MTVTRMATPRGPIPVTVVAFEASGRGGGGGGIPGGGVGMRSADAHIGIMEKIIETTIVHWGCIRITENKKETTIVLNLQP